MGAEELSRCVPVYEELPGWLESTVGVKDYKGLPKAARKYLRRIEELCSVPIDMMASRWADGMASKICFDMMSGSSMNQ